MSLVVIAGNAESFSDPLTYLLAKIGFEVAVCPTGRGALKACQYQGAAIVLVDLLLGRESALEICQGLHERSDIPVIVLNGPDNEFGRLAGLELGADDYVPVLFSWNDLVARISALLTGAHACPHKASRREVARRANARSADLSG